jgi:cytidyltransferase-like protein
MKIGLVAGSYKPFHSGHDALIRRAAAENDRVMLFVSTSDRKRPGEVPISGSVMAHIWKAHIEHTLPKNVEVTYGGSPVGNVYKALGIANDTGSTATFNIYSDPSDIAESYPNASLKKYAGKLYARGQINLVPTPRTSTVNVSGTEMRRYLAAGDKKSFVQRLPRNIDADAVWRELKGSVVESLLRCYIGTLLRSII